MYLIPPPAAAVSTPLPAANAPPRDRAPRLPPTLRASLRDAVMASFGAIPDGVDIDELGLGLVEAIGLVVSLKARDIHRSRESRS